MVKKSISVRLVSVVLVIVTAFSVFAITASAYSTGTYAVASSSGSNVRNGAGANYSKVGAAVCGTTFNVSRISGEWGYTSSIRCTNGTRSGWVSLRYCTKKAPATTQPAAQYPTGNYAVASSSGSNVRNGAGSGYSKVGAATKGTTFYVSRVSGEWGYTSSIRCTNGTRSGWVSLKYCTRQNPVTSAPTTKPSGATVRLNVPMFKQTDSRWSKVYIGNRTIGQIGCTTTCIAMVYSYKTGKTVYPNAVMKKLRYANNDLYWSSISNVGLTSKAYNCNMSNKILSDIYSKLKAGKPVIIGALTASKGDQHWVVITGYTGTSTTSFSTADFTINDPGYQGSKTLKAFLANGSRADRTYIARIMY